MPLTHYIIVRRDMPLGVVCAQITHAAGESFALWAMKHINYDIHNTTAVVLGVRDEKQLRYYYKRLINAEIPAIFIYENAGPFADQVTAVGVYPTYYRGEIFKLLKKLNPISELSYQKRKFCEDFYISDLHVIEECSACTKLLG